MVGCMKTTIEISESLLQAARNVMAGEKTTLRALVEEGLRAVLVARMGRRRFELRNLSFAGNGLQAGFRHDRWEDLRDAAYEDRGA